MEKRFRCNEECNHSARLLRLQTEFQGTDREAQQSVLYDDNYFDFASGDSRSIQVTLPAALRQAGHLSGHVRVEGTNVVATMFQSTLERTDGRGLAPKAVAEVAQES